MTTSSGIIITKDVDENVTSEGVAEILAITPKTAGEELPMSEGDKIIYRGFLRFCNQLGDLHGSTRNSEFFLINVDDLLAVVSGPCKIGLYGEYIVE
tara:strand:- start:24 stop:314 length:291 start_codon:yes stop_codon:yes gene_type:complete